MNQIMHGWMDMHRYMFLISTRQEHHVSQNIFSTSTQEYYFLIPDIFHAVEHVFFLLILVLIINGRRISCLCLAHKLFFR